MSPKEKAKELKDKYMNVKWQIYIDDAKQCALIAVDEVIQQLTPIEKAPNNKFAFQYWQEVKQEIEKL
jgi:hypothetical protein